MTRADLPTTIIVHRRAETRLDPFTGTIYRVILSHVGPHLSRHTAYTPIGWIDEPATAVWLQPGIEDRAEILNAWETVLLETRALLARSGG